MRDVLILRKAGHGQPFFSAMVKDMIFLVLLFLQFDLTGLNAAEPVPQDKEESSSTPEGRITAPSPEGEGKAENMPEDRRKEDDRESSGYPRSYIVPKGLCEGSEPVIKIER
ncbi:MAG: hypothetical protein WC291_10150 [Thermodesulfovibrionales bacterium]|jgi:hypothetical protein